MIVTTLSFKKIDGYTFICGAMLALSIGILQAQAPTSASAPAKSTLTIHLTGFRNAKGKVNINLFRDGKGFPLDPAGIVKSGRLEIDPKAAVASPRPGSYCKNDVRFPSDN